jgi:hypothetical protein
MLLLASLILSAFMLLLASYCVNGPIVAFTPAFAYVPAGGAVMLLLSPLILLLLASLLLPSLLLLASLL